MKRKLQKVQSGDHRVAASGVSLAMSLELLGMLLDLVGRIQDALARLDSVLEVNNDDLSFEGNIVEDPICIIKNEVSNCSGVIAAEMEGIKPDMSILEGRFANAIKENKSDIGLLQRQLKELEGIIRHQDEVICKLCEDNLVLKSKLSAIENLTPKVTYYEHKDNKYANEPVSLIPVNDQSTSQVIDQSTRSNTNNLKPIDNSNIDHLTPNEFIMTIRIINMLMIRKVRPKLLTNVHLMGLTNRPI